VPTVRQAADTGDEGWLRWRKRRQLHEQLPTAAQRFVEGYIAQYDSFRFNGCLFLKLMMPALRI
jgi:hypothetical protein